MDDDNRRTTPRPQLARDPKFEEISPDVLDDALADLVEEDPDHAMNLLAQMRGATDRQLAAMAAHRRPMVLDVAEAGPVRRGVGTMASSPADQVQGDLDLDRSLEGLVHARATGGLVDGRLRVRHWTQPATALSLVIDRSGSMSGKRSLPRRLPRCEASGSGRLSVLAFRSGHRGEEPGRRSFVAGGRR